MKNKYISNVVVLALFFGLPLCWKPALLVHPYILFMMAATSVIWLTQPAITPQDAAQNRSSDRYSVWVILLFSAVSIITPLVEWAYFQPVNPAKMFGIVPMTGVMLVAGGIALRLWAIRTLGLFFTSTVQIKKGHQIITSGPYAYLRHPSYTGAYLSFCGCSVLLQAWTGLLVCLLFMGLAYYIRVRIEEDALITSFGRDYLEYRRYTWRMLPWIW